MTYNKTYISIDFISNEFPIAVDMQLFLLALYTKISAF